MLLHGLLPHGEARHGLFQLYKQAGRGEKIQIFNYGDMKRDFTYIDDTETGAVNVMCGPDETEDGASKKIYNIGNKPEDLLYFVETLEKCLMSEGI